tara:strand:+ start:869 stop:2107 length:1239 start_codon:yes stop_codon:yes gene_type:complete
VNKKIKLAAAIASANLTYAMDKSERKIDINGWPEIKGNPISKVGVFPYLGKSIDHDGALGLDPEEIYQVLRSKEELSSQECIDSFKLLPWVDDHTMLGDESEGMTPAEQKGIEGVIGEDVYFDDADNTLKGNLKLFSNNLLGIVDEGKKELSLGYRCAYRLKSGNFNGKGYDVEQHTIRGNHLASVDEGRMGPDIAVMDSAEKITFSIDSKEFVMDPELKKILEMLEAMAKRIEALEGKKAEDMKDPKDAEGEKDPKAEDKKAEDMGGNGPEKDAKEAEDMKDADKEKGAEAADSMDAATIKSLQADISKMQTSMDSMQKDGMKSLMGQISKRDALASKLSDLVGVFDHSEMTVEDVAKYGVEKLTIACDSGAELATLNGYLAAKKPKAVTAEDGALSPDANAVDSYLNGDK